MVLDDPVADLLMEFFDGQSASDLRLEGLTSFAGVHDAMRGRRSNVLAGSGESENELVYSEPGIHTSAENHDAVILRGLVETATQVGMLAERIRKLFAGGNNVHFRIQAVEQLRLDRLQVRGRCVHDDVGVLFEYSRCIVADSDSEIATDAGDLAEVLTCFVGSMSIAPMIFNSGFWAIRRTIPAPMGPTPY